MIRGAVLPLVLPPDAASVLCIGAHADDIEIGCGGMVLSLREERPALRFDWVVLSGDGPRGREAADSAERFLGPCAARSRVVVREFRDGYFPYDGAAVKDVFEELKREVRPDLVLTHARWDAHQDHRIVNELTWNTFREHLILEYEVPKYDGDLGRPNCYMPLGHEVAARKIEYLLASFPSQRSKRWFTEETFRAMLRLRGVEAGGTLPYAEAFYAHKLVIAAPPPAGP